MSCGLGSSLAVVRRAGPEMRVFRKSQKALSERLLCMTLHLWGDRKSKRPDWNPGCALFPRSTPPIIALPNCRLARACNEQAYEVYFQAKGSWSEHAALRAMPPP